MAPASSGGTAWEQRKPACFAFPVRLGGGVFRGLEKIMRTTVFTALFSILSLLVLVVGVRAVLRREPEER
ncbi:hypothetical protein GCM10022220_22090 [Actinocatenispora rupis]|uniref:Uncharacterized protein n=1 Tax=Actinocatenispora rupis TaxID=519421 RepID=A0A8J3IZL2_9ACTN|nr:hypothetical protein Aru02nite_26340 [Actinocatenispora rupis]